MHGVNLFPLVHDELTSLTFVLLFSNKFNGRGHPGSQAAEKKSTASENDDHVSISSSSFLS